MSLRGIYEYMHINSRRTVILVSVWVLGWLLLAVETRPQGTFPMDPGVARIMQILKELQDNAEQGAVANRTYEVSEKELNAYLLAQLEQQDQKAVESIALLIKDGTFLTRVEVDADELEFQGDEVTTGFLKLLLTGIQTLEVEGKLHAENGMATYRVQQARLSGYEVPATLVNNLLSSLGKRNDPPFDPTQPFEMPYGIQSVTFQPGKLMMRTGDGGQDTGE